ncbi:MAG: hypothetical protein K0R51_2192 [Cytophagaceae bacterium]|jgi:hypothetical protein|nr:hypothetical protein [Cytophagaceae bacterium]
MGEILRLPIILALIVNCYSIKAQVAPYSLSPRWVFGNRGEFNFTGAGAPAQPARTDNIIANEGASTLCLPNKTLLVYDNNVRVAGNNHTPLGTVMNSSSSSTQGGIILNNPSVPAGTSFFWITGNAESVYSFEEPNDNAQQGIRIYSGAQAGTSVTAPTVVSTLTTNATSPWESLYSSSNGNYGYYVITGGANTGSSGAVNINAWSISSTGAVGGVVNNSYASNWWNSQAQTSIKVNRCQTKIAIATATKIAVFNWDRTTGTIGSVIKDLDINVGGGSKMYGCEFSANGNYLYATTLGGSNLVVVDLTVAGTTTGLSYKVGQTASGSLQIGPNDVIYVANGLDASSVTSIGTITNANTGGTYNPTGLALANSSSVRLGIANIPWLNPQRPTFTATKMSCGRYSFEPSFLTHFNDVIDYDQAEWDFNNDGVYDRSKAGTAADDTIQFIYTTGATGNRTVRLRVRDEVCQQTWVGTLTFNVDCILPVDLISFNGMSKDGGVQLTWKTAMEKNNDYFDIQRSSDGVHFESIGTQKGAGNSNRVIDYSYFDANVSGTRVYYRLVQHDFDGASESSHVIVVNFDQSLGSPIAVAPNPFSSSFTLTKFRDEAATVAVYDVYGRLLESKVTIEGEAVLQLGESLANGSYILRYQNASGVYTFHVEKK